MTAFSTIGELLAYTEAHYDYATALNEYNGTEWIGLSNQEMIKEIKAITLWLKEIGLNKGDKVGILAPPCIRWTLIDLASIAAGLVVVPLFANISHENFVYECTQTNIKTLFVAGEEQWKMWSHHKDLFNRVISIENDAFDHKETPEATTYKTVIESGDVLLKKNPDTYRAMLSEIKPEDLATIIYTSGSTGIPKGAMLTNSNLANTSSPNNYDLGPETDKYLSIVPLAHVLGRSLNIIMLKKNVPIYYFNEPKEFAKACQQVHPTIIALVPRLLEKMYAKMVSTVDSAGFLKRSIGQWAFSLANEEHEGLYKTLLHPLADKIVYSAIREKLGGAFKYVICGGAALNPHLCNFFIDIGIPIFEGYGLTESTIVSVNTPRDRIVGTVGQPIGDIKVKTSNDGELLIKGPVVFAGYYNAPKATADIFDEEGWLKTGDKASIDEKGFITIIGRIKELYKSSIGEYIAPVPIEQQLAKAPIVDMSIIIADKRKYVSCLIFPSVEVIQSLKKEQKLDHLSDEEFLNSDYMKKEMDSLIESINSHLNHWEQIHAYRFVLDPPTIEGGELTPSMKIRRSLVEEKYKSLIDSMYPEEAHL